MGATVSCSLNLWCDNIGVDMPKCRVTTLLVRVSSARINEHCFNTSMLLGAMSARFPTGVGTTYNLPFILRVWMVLSGWEKLA